MGHMKTNCLKLFEPSVALHLDSFGPPVVFQWIWYCSGALYYSLAPFCNMYLGMRHHKLPFEEKMTKNIMWFKITYYMLANPNFNSDKVNTLVYANILNF